GDVQAPRSQPSGGGGRASQSVGHRRDGGEGFPRTLPAYASAISKLGRSGKWQQSLGLLAEAEEIQLQPDAVLISSVITSCEKAGRWAEALWLLQDLRCRGLPPSL
ncbi:unnamed protein product, partial [Polarella glacialis]